MTLQSRLISEKHSVNNRLQKAFTRSASTGETLSLEAWYCGTHKIRPHWKSAELRAKHPFQCVM